MTRKAGAGSMGHLGVGSNAVVVPVSRRRERLALRLCPPTRGEQRPGACHPLLAWDDVSDPALGGLLVAARVLNTGRHAPHARHAQWRTSAHDRQVVERSSSVVARASKDGSSMPVR